MLVSLIADCFHIRFHIIPVGAERLAEIHDHVDLVRAVLAGQLGFVALGFRGAVAMREADDAADEHPRAAQPLHRLLHGVGLDANGGHLVLRGQFASGFEVRVRHRGMQEAVVDHFGEVGVAVLHGVWIG